jgi:hypothetical protein
MCIIASPPSPIWSDVVIDVGLEMQLNVSNNFTNLGRGQVN